MDDKETSCQGGSFGDFKSVDKIVRFYYLPNQKTKTSKDKVILSGEPQGKICEPWHIAKICVQD